MTFENCDDDTCMHDVAVSVADQLREPLRELFFSLFHEPSVGLLVEALHMPQNATQRFGDAQNLTPDVALQQAGCPARAGQRNTLFEVFQEGQLPECDVVDEIPGIFNDASALEPDPEEESEDDTESIF